jgi:hypothetical protein
MKPKIKEHFSSIDNITIYLICTALFFYEIFNRGPELALKGAAALAFLPAGWFVVAYVFGSIRARDFSISIGSAIALLYFFGFIAYWILNFGLNRKAAILALPIYTGMVLLAGYWITTSETYDRLRKWEKVMYGKMFSIFRKKK